MRTNGRPRCRRLTGDEPVHALELHGVLVQGVGDVTDETSSARNPQEEETC